MSTLTFADVDEILRIVDQFPAAEVRFEHGDLKLFVKRAGSGSSAAASAGAASAPAVLQPPAAATQVAPAPAGAPSAASASATSSSAVPASPAAPAKRSAAATQTNRVGQTSIESPLMGVYYAAPSPDADPFVKPGQKVAKGATLCIIEVMKVMNDVRAPFAGVVVEIVATNGAMVEQGQPLMWIKPEGQA